LLFAVSDSGCWLIDAARPGRPPPEWLCWAGGRTRILDTWYL